MRRSAFLLLALLALPVVGRPAIAADRPIEAYNGGFLDAFSRMLFVANHYIYAGLSTTGRALSGPASPAAGDEQPPSKLGQGIGNVASNLVNEPVTAVAGLATGSFGTSLHAARRFAINTTAGVLGWYDVAAERGLERRHEDIGLLFCRAGIGEGGYIVFPLVGPRTLRDGIADIGVTNAILWGLTGAALGGGITLQAVIIAESLELLADIFAVRQMDSRAADMNFADYDTLRAAYLTERRERCAKSIRDAAVAAAPTAFHLAPSSASADGAEILVH